MNVRSFAHRLWHGAQPEVAQKTVEAQPLQAALRDREDTGVNIAGALDHLRINTGNTGFSIPSSSSSSTELGHLGAYLKPFEPERFPLFRQDNE